MSQEMEMYGQSTPDIFRIDDLLDFSNEDLFSSSTADTNAQLQEVTTSNCVSTTTTDTIPSFPHDLCLPNDDVAELEWLSNFVDDSFSNFSVTNLNSPPNTISFPGKPRSKRPKATIARHTWTSSSESDTPAINNNWKNHVYSPPSIRGRKCTHCASEKTPQWRTGPMGPKTLCNACGVRFKSGRLVPEYRPAASPTFVLTQHSNSHRKVLELRRQKEVLVEDGTQFFHHHDFQVC